MKRILAIFPILLLYWSSVAQNIESISLRIDQVINLKTNELSGGDDSYISYRKGSAKVRFYPETKIINRTALDRNYFEREVLFPISESIAKDVISSESTLRTTIIPVISILISCLIQN